LQRDGKVLVGGDFEKFNDTLTGSLIRLNSDGSLDRGIQSAGWGGANRISS
jgi:hypothetical protein